MKQTWPFSRRLKQPEWRVRSLFACVMTLALLLAYTSWNARNSAQDHLMAHDRQVHTMKVLLETSQIRAAPLGMIRGHSGYLLTGASVFSTIYAEGRSDLQARLVRLGRLVKDDPLQRARVGKLAQQAARFERTLDQLNALQREGRHDAAIARVRTGESRVAIDAMVREIESIETVERYRLLHRYAVARRAAEENARNQHLLTNIGLLLVGLTLISAIYVHRALAAENAVRRDLQQIANTDPLTGIANRRSLLDRLKHNTQSDRTLDQTFSFAIFDIDHFKRINDRFGHPVGDGVICETVRRVSETLRSNDLLGRLGGEEFGVLLPATDEHTARAICERLRVALADRPIRCGDSIVPITASFGVAYRLPSETMEQVMARADAALYQAKNGGRNMVLLAA